MFEQRAANATSFLAAIVVGASVTLGGVGRPLPLPGYWSRPEPSLPAEADHQRRKYFRVCAVPIRLAPVPLHFACSIRRRRVAAQPSPSRRLHQGKRSTVCCNTWPGNWRGARRNSAPGRRSRIGLGGAPGSASAALRMRFADFAAAAFFQRVPTAERAALFRLYKRALLLKPYSATVDGKKAKGRVVHVVLLPTSCAAPAVAKSI